VLVFIAHGWRTLVPLNVTAHPTAAWVWRQLIEATAWGRRPRFLLRDRDAVYGGDFAQRAAALGVETLLATGARGAPPPLRPRRLIAAGMLPSHRYAAADGPTVDLG
jgi:hypothetical protein